MAAQDNKISTLNEEELHWLYVAVWKMIISDPWVNEKKLTLLHEAMPWVDKEEMEQLEELIQKLKDEFPLSPPQDLNEGKKEIMWNKILPIASINGKVSLKAMKLIKRIGKHLGYNEGKIQNALNQVQERAREIAQQLGLRSPSPQIKNLYH